MIGLPHTYRFTAYNGTGVSIAAGAVKVYARRRRIAATDGQLFHETTEAVVYTNAGAIAHTAQEVGATISNATDKWLSGDFVFEITITGAPTGDAFLYLERSTDAGGTHWGETAFAAVVGKLTLTAASTRRMDFSL